MTAWERWSVSIPAGAAVDSGGNAEHGLHEHRSHGPLRGSYATGVVSAEQRRNWLFSVANAGGPAHRLPVVQPRRRVLHGHTVHVVRHQRADRTESEGFSSTGGSSCHLPRRRLRPTRPVPPLDRRSRADGGRRASQADASSCSRGRPDTRLKGWVDLHTHPMSNLAFGGKLFHGAPTVGSLMPAVQMPNDPECRFDKRATSIAEALATMAPTHGDRFQSQCGELRAQHAMIRALEAFNGAARARRRRRVSPRSRTGRSWNDITHQKMWIDWIRRSWDGGQRVMVALSHNNRTLAELARRRRTDQRRHGRPEPRPICRSRRSRRSSPDHPDFMEGGADARRTLRASCRRQARRRPRRRDRQDRQLQRPAAASTPQTVEAEIDRLYAQGVRYILPIHLTDNVFGDTAIYSRSSTSLNFRENGSVLDRRAARSEATRSASGRGLPVLLNPFIPPGCRRRPPRRLPARHADRAGLHRPREHAHRRTGSRRSVSSRSRR